MFEIFWPTQLNPTHLWEVDGASDRLLQWELVDHLDDTEYLEKIENGVNNYVIRYTICDD